MSLPDLLSSPEALRGVCQVENAVYAMPSYDEFCYDEPVRHESLQPTLVFAARL